MKIPNKLFPQLPKTQTGATMVEYAIMIALIAVVSITIIGTLGNKVNNTFNSVSSAMPANG